MKRTTKSDTILKSGYGLKHIKNNVILGVSVRETDAECSVGETYTLSTYSEPMWIVKDKLTASYVRKFSTPWYNADYETPINPFKPEELTVVKIEIKATLEDPDYVPTFEEYMNLRYNTPGVRYYDPEHVKCVLDQCKQFNRPGSYSIYDLKILYDDNKQLKEEAN
jgi:hypothetical protein